MPAPGRCRPASGPSRHPASAARLYLEATSTLAGSRRHARCSLATLLVIVALNSCVRRSCTGGGRGGRRVLGGCAGREGVARGRGRRGTRTPAQAAAGGSRRTSTPPTHKPASPQAHHPTTPTARLGDGLQDLVNLRLKVHVEQAVGLVQHQVAQALEREALCVGQMVHHAPRRAHHNVRPLGQRDGLATGAKAAAGVSGGSGGRQPRRQQRCRQLQPSPFGAPAAACTPRRPARQRRACAIMSMPPTSTAHLTPMPAPSASNCSAIWIASSLRAAVAEGAGRCGVMWAAGACGVASGGHGSRGSGSALMCTQRQSAAAAV